MLLSTTPAFDALAELHAADGAKGDRLGWSVAFVDDIAVVGAYNADPVGRDSGAAYVFERGVPGDNSSWTQVGKLVAGDGARSDAFGKSVAITGNSGIGYTIAVGADKADGATRDTGAVYVFSGNHSTWTETAKLTASDGSKDDRFGTTRALAIDGDTLVVGAPQYDGIGSSSGMVYVYTATGNGDWSLTSTLIAHDIQSGGTFGTSVDVSGNTLAVGSHGAAAAYVFEGSGASWSERAKLTRADEGPLGIAVAVSNGGDAVATSYWWSVWPFDKPSGGWTDHAADSSLIMKAWDSPEIRFGATLDIETDANGNDVLLVGASAGGYAYQYRQVSDATLEIPWSPLAKLIPDQPGTAGVATNGETFLLGNVTDDGTEPGGLGLTDAGSLHVFQPDLGPTPGITAAPTSGLVTSENEGSDTFDVVLDTQPSANVVISVSSSDSTEGTAWPVELTFTTTDWSTPQTVTVTGVDDSEIDGDIGYAVMLDPSDSADQDYAALVPFNVSVTNVDNENSPPVALDDSATTTVDTAVTVNVLANDSDPNGDLLTVTAVAYSGAGNVVPDATTVTYTPASGFTGNDSFTYTISDGNGGTAEAEVSITVEPASAELAVTAIAPPSMGIGESIIVTVTGSGFDPGAVLTIRGPRAPKVSNMVVDSSTTIFATVTAHKKFGGTYDVVVTNPDTSTANLPGAFSVGAAAKAGFTSAEIDAALASLAELDSANEDDTDPIADTLTADLTLMLVEQSLRIPAGRSHCKTSLGSASPVPETEVWTVGAAKRQPKETNDHAFLSRDAITSAASTR